MWKNIMWKNILAIRRELFRFINWRLIPLLTGKRVVLCDYLHGYYQLDECPKPPKWIFDGVVDQGRERWRYNCGRLVRYVRYENEEPGEGGKAPAVIAVWTRR